MLKLKILVFTIARILRGVYTNHMYSNRHNDTSLCLVKLQK